MHIYIYTKIYIAIDRQMKMGHVEKAVHVQVHKLKSKFVSLCIPL